MTRRTLSLLGSTGSVGRSTVDLIASVRDQFEIKALTAYKNAELLIEQALLLQPDIVAIGDEAQYDAVKTALSGKNIKVLAGRAGVLEAAAQKVDWVMAAIVGVAGLEPVMQAIRNAKAVAIANKEPLVAAGALVMAEAQRCGTKILPVDSEHNAIFQVFENQNRAAIDRIILTASGGPFRTWAAKDIASATPEQAIAHPNWSMGAKISVDSASMMNKGLEVIEAHHLFAMPAEQIDIVFHPQSVIHSMVEYADGSVLAQLGAPDMRTPIAYALAWPERMKTTGQKLDWQKLRQLDFSPPDTEKFPCLPLCYQALRDGISSCITLNAANEAAVEAFLKKKISFGDIPRLIERELNAGGAGAISTIEDVIALDQSVRARMGL
jgi:1-deoxy-D-xylulose-5-phosphate reductoisomerase